MKLRVGDHVIVLMTHETQETCTAPYWVLELGLNTVTVRPVDQPYEQSIVVNQDQVTKCPAELPNIMYMDGS